MNIEILAKLGGGVSRMDGLPGGRSAGELAGVELAGLLAGVDDLAMAYALVKYVGDSARFALLQQLVRSHVLSICTRRRWRAVQLGQVQALADGVVVESISPCVCPRCRGVGYVGARSCKRCDGVGRVSWSTRTWAGIVSVDESAFRRHWQDRLNDARGVLCDAEAEVVRAVRCNSRQD